MAAFPNLPGEVRHTGAKGDDVLVIRTAFEGGTFVIALYGEVDLANADHVERVLLKAETTDAKEIVLDLSGLHFIDSTGVQLLVNASARSRADSHRLSLLRGTDPVQRALEICGVADRLPFVG